MARPTPDVYGTARGPLPRLASPLAARARARRHARFFSLARVAAGARVLDLGCGELGLRALEPQLDITGVDVHERAGYPGPFVRADATVGLPFGDRSFDLVYCSSVLEHIAPPQRAHVAAEIRRVGRGWFVQTPAREFPIEPHSLLPGAHWLGPRARALYWRLGAGVPGEEISLLGRREMVALFGEPLQAERVGPLVKSWISLRAPDTRPAPGARPPTGGATRSAAEPADVVGPAVDHEERQQHDPH
ncbi:MAG: methyltransferase domain-containing protein [Solirubrobacterales bacterium]|nr:methyltransferase domain-containing protein [Solirubrobacterales bacterium]